VDGELEPNHTIELQAHLEECVGCADRVKFARASRASVRNMVKTVRAPESLRRRVEIAVAAARHEQSTDVMVGTSRMVSWRFAGPMAAAAALALVWAAVGKMHNRAVETDGGWASASSDTSNRASMISMDAVLDALVDQHANPLPPEATDPSEFIKFDQFVGVPVRMMTQEQLNGHLVGGRMVPIYEQRAAMLQYVLQSGRRVSIYIYNPRRVRIDESPALRERVVEDAPVYTGYVRGYSVAVTDRRGVGYAMASDLDEVESSRLLVAAGR
jgi:anti-sigma factor RsiW